MIYTLRKNKGISQGDLALMLGVNQAHLSLIENGKRMPRPATLSKIAHAMGVSVELFSDKNFGIPEPMTANEMIRVGSALLEQGRKQKEVEK